MNYQQVIEKIYTKVLADKNLGSLANYIPELSKIDSKKFGVHISTTDNKEFYTGDSSEKFSIQSVVKVFSLIMAYRLLGRNTWDRVGVEPSGTAFNSLVQLEADKGKPRNPFINSGALVICDMLISNLQNPKQEFLNFINTVSHNSDIQFSQKIISSEKLVGFRNIALCNYIKSYGNIENSPEEVLDLYFTICSIEMSCQELSRASLFLANNGRTLATQEQILNSSQTKRINAIMQTCGFYDESGEFSFKVGLPGKSGVGGGIIAIHPSKYSIAVWSPKLNAKGNSYRGMKFLEQLTTQLQSSIF